MQSTERLGRSNKRARSRFGDLRRKPYGYFGYPVIALGLLALPLMVPGARAGDRVNQSTALVLRGVNGVNCDPNGIAQGSDPQTKPDQDVQNLSVNCAPDGGDVNKLRKGLPQAHICWATLSELESRRSDIMVETDPLPDNANHCLVRDITPNEMVKALHYRG